MRVTAAVIALSALIAAPASAQDLKISGITPIPIDPGVNRIAHFAPDGRAAVIVRAWRDNGNAHGHDVYLVTLPLRTAEGPQNTMGVVAVDDGKAALQDTATTAPFDGERVLGTLRFARAMVDGAPATLMIRADLGDGVGGVSADHAPATVSVYVLKSPGVEVGTTPDVFKLAFKVRAVGAYCNADMALNQTLGVPLPNDYAGGKAPSGCLG